MDGDMRIEITQRDIELGGHSCDHCPIHRAMIRAIGPVEIVVQSYLIRIAGRTYKTPVAVANWLRDYDRHGIGVPFEFELKL